jgi:hypothetical protein
LATLALDKKHFLARIPTEIRLAFWRPVSSRPSHSHSLARQRSPIVAQMILSSSSDSAISDGGERRNSSWKLFHCKDIKQCEL